ncbi:MAG: LysM domain-containing protein [Candidatus Fermentibacteraceae bacterium]
MGCRILAMTAALGLLLAPVAAEAENYEYMIGYGDTLWDLAVRFYGDPQRWEEILQANPELSGPGSLQPGETIVIPGVEGDIQGEAGQPATDYSTVTVPNSAANVPMLSRLRIETAGWVATEPLNPVAYVVGVDVEETDELRKDIAIMGDLLELDLGSNDGVEPGAVYTLLRECETVDDPETGDHLGQVIRVTGLCRVLETRSETSIAKLEHAYLPVEAGDVVTPYEPAGDVYINPQPAVEDLTAYVVGVRNPRIEDAFPYDVVYIDRGSSDNLSVGDMFALYEYGETVTTPAGETVQTADIPVVEMVILTTTPRTASALLSNSLNSNLIQAGERVHLVRRSQ